ncbi:MAG TPA: GNAT family N-acetyltransferase [Flavisolibacter sp.]|nr:GNAT family N-acetyltransferase [Flavisolibacter sp.]
MTIQHKEGKKRGVFFIEGDDAMLAQIVYTVSTDNIMIIEHTEVDKALRGKNIGYELVHKSADYARTHGMKVSPLCPFAKAVMDKKPEFRDLLV